MSAVADRLYGDPELAGFYDLDNGWGPDLDFCARLASGARSVLDLGCGTGLLCAALAPGREVVGVDPAGAMLEIARARAPRVRWIEADARSVRIGRRFDLIVMTGNAFQTFLTDDDQRAVLGTVAAHLAPAGRFVFDTRNPVREEWREWSPAASRRMLRHPLHGEVTAWNDARHDPATGFVSYDTVYRVEATGRIFSATSLIRFSPRPHVERLLAAAGLAPERWLGDWGGSAFAEDAAEIIPIGALRDRAGR